VTVEDSKSAKTADRKLLVSELSFDGPPHRVVLDEPTFVEVGDRYWLEGSEFIIERVDGSRTVISTGADRHAVRQFEGLIWLGDEPGQRFSFIARSLDEAKNMLEQQYGIGHRYTMWNEADANRLRG
jgi:hypothetical protein